MNPGSIFLVYGMYSSSCSGVGTRKLLLLFLREFFRETPPPPPYVYVCLAGVSCVYAQYTHLRELIAGFVLQIWSLRPPAPGLATVGYRPPCITAWLGSNSRYRRLFVTLLLYMFRGDVLPSSLLLLKVGTPQIAVIRSSARLRDAAAAATPPDVLRDVMREEGGQALFRVGR